MTIPPTVARWGAPAVLTALPLLFFWRITLLGEVVYWGTPLLQFYPWRTLAAAAWRAGQLPLWNPWSDFGAPLAANLQTAAFSPLNLVYLVLPVETAMGWTIVTHVMLAGLFMYWLGRTLRLSVGGALIAALAYAFSGFVISRAGFLSMTGVVPWFPALLAATELTLRAAVLRQRRAERTALLAFVTGMLLVAGHIQLAFYSLLAAVAWTLVRAASITTDKAGPDEGTGAGLLPGSSSNNRPSLLRYVSSLLPVAFGLALGTGLAAVQLLPTAELTLHSHRRDGPGYDYAMNYSLYPFQLAQVVAPDVLGSPVTGDYRGPGNYWEGTSYLGAVAFLLALIGARFSSHPARWSLVALAAVGWVFALGRHSPVYPWVFEHVPGFGLFQAPARLLYWWTLAGALLAGLGLDVLRFRGGDPRLRPWTRLPLGAAAGIGGGVAAALVIVGPAGVAGSSLTALAKAAALLTVSAGLLALAPRLGRRFPPIAAALLFADLFLAGHALNPTASPDLYRTPVTPAVVPQGELPARITMRDDDFEARFAQVFGLRDFGSSETNVLLPIRASLYPNLGALAGVPDAMSYDPLKLERSWQLRALADRAADPGPLLRFMGVGAVFDRHGTARPAPQPLPRTFFAPEVVSVAGLAEARRFLEQSDPLRTVVVEAPPGALPPLSGQPPVITRTEARDGMVAAVETEGASPGVLVVTESWYPGWTARLDGTPVPVYPASLAFRAVAVPAGHHRITFSYEPVSVAAGLGVSGVSLAVTLVLAGWAVRPRRNGA